MGRKAYMDVGYSNVSTVVDMCPFLAAEHPNASCLGKRPLVLLRGGTLTRYRKQGTPEILFPFPLAARARRCVLGFINPAWDSNKTPANNVNPRDSSQLFTAVELRVSVGDMQQNPNYSVPWCNLDCVLHPSFSGFVLIFYIDFHPFPPVMWDTNYLPNTFLLKISRTEFYLLLRILIYTEIFPVLNKTNL